MHAYREGSKPSLVHGSTGQDMRQDGFQVFFWDVFFGGLVLDPFPPLQWTSFPPPVTAVLITLKGAASTGSRYKSNRCAGFVQLARGGRVALVIPSLGAGCPVRFCFLGAHIRVIVSFLHQVHGGVRPRTEGSRENIGHNFHV